MQGDKILFQNASLFSLCSGFNHLPRAHDQTPYCSNDIKKNFARWGSMLKAYLYALYTRLKKIGPFRRSLSFASSPRILSYFLRSVHLNIPHIFQFNHASFGKFRGISEETLMHRRVPR